MSKSDTEKTTTIEGEILDKSVEFPQGIPGFPNLKRFVFARQPEEHPFAWMRSMDDEHLAFAVVEAYHLDPDFSFEVNDKELEIIGSPSAEFCAVFFIVKIDVSGEKVKITFKRNAPLIVNTHDRLGRQVVVPTENKNDSQDTVLEF